MLLPQKIKLILDHAKKAKGICEDTLKHCNAEKMNSCHWLQPICLQMQRMVNMLHVLHREIYTYYAWLSSHFLGKIHEVQALIQKLENLANHANKSYLKIETVRINKNRASAFKNLKEDEAVALIAFEQLNYDVEQRGERGFDFLSEWRRVTKHIAEFNPLRVTNYRSTLPDNYVNMDSNDRILEATLFCGYMENVLLDITEENDFKNNFIVVLYPEIITLLEEINVLFIDIGGDPENNQMTDISSMGISVAQICSILKSKSKKSQVESVLRSKKNNHIKPIGSGRVNGHISNLFNITDIIKIYPDLARVCRNAGVILKQNYFVSRLDSGNYCCKITGEPKSQNHIRQH